MTPAPVNPARRRTAEPGEHARALTNSGRAHSRRRPHYLRRIHARMSLSSRARLLFARERRAGSATTTPAWTCIRFSGACSPGSSRKCGSCSDRRGRFWWWRRAPASGAWPATFWISARARFPNFMRRWNMSPWSAPRARRAEHAARLAAHAAAGRVSSAAEIPSAIPAGCIFSNELLDALPAHRVVMEQRRAARSLRGIRRRAIHRSSARAFHAGAGAIFSASRELRLRKASRRKCAWKRATGSKARGAPWSAVSS